MLDRTLDDFDDAGGAAAHLIRFELAMLAELGFGLDLENCAATGATADLIYVSPKSGGAVSRVAGEPYRDRLLRLPSFLREGEVARTAGRTRTCRTVFASPGCFCCATCWSRADRAIPTPGTGSSTLLRSGAWAGAALSAGLDPRKSSSLSAPCLSNASQQQFISHIDVHTRCRRVDRRRCMHVSSSFVDLPGRGALDHTGLFVIRALSNGYGAVVAFSS